MLRMRIFAAGTSCVPPALSGGHLIDDRIVARSLPKAENVPRDVGPLNSTPPHGRHLDSCRGPESSTGVSARNSVRTGRASDRGRCPGQREGLGTPLARFWSPPTAVGRGHRRGGPTVEAPTSAGYPAAEVPHRSVITSCVAEHQTRAFSGQFLAFCSRAHGAFHNRLGITDPTPGLLSRGSQVRVLSFGELRTPRACRGVPGAPSAVAPP